MWWVLRLRGLDIDLWYIMLNCLALMYLDLTDSLTKGAWVWLRVQLGPA